MNTFSIDIRKTIKWILSTCAVLFLLGCSTTGSQIIQPKVYGNWCGPGHPKNVESAVAPIDVLDEACKRHDLCYVEKGYLNCECDSVFNAELSVLASQSTQYRERLVFIRSFQAYFKTSPCDGDHKDKVAPSRAAHSIYNRIENKVKGFIRMLPFSSGGESELREAEK